MSFLKELRNLHFFFHYIAWKVFVFGVILVRIFRIRTEYGEVVRISPCSVQIRVNTDQNNSKYGPILHSVSFKEKMNWSIAFTSKVNDDHILPSLFSLGGVWNYLQNNNYFFLWRHQFYSEDADCSCYLCPQFAELFQEVLRYWVTLPVI